MRSSMSVQTRLGVKLARSWTISMPISLRCSALKAVIATGTDSIFCSRFSATTTSSPTVAVPVAVSAALAVAAIACVP